jgi:hypothetical protein
MAVRAEQSKVLQSVVKPVSVHMVKRHGQWSAAPAGRSTLLASMLFDAGGQQSQLEVAASHPPSVHQIVLERG